MAWADPEVADGVDADDEEDDEDVEDDEDDEDDDALLAGVLVAELAVPAAAVLCCVAAGNMTAIAAAAPALATPAPAVTASSLVLPLRRRCLALASSASASAGSRSGDIAILRSTSVNVRYAIHTRRPGSAGRAGNLSDAAEPPAVHTQPEETQTPGRAHLKRYDPGDGTDRERGEAAKVRYCTFRLRGGGDETTPGRVEGDEVITLQAPTLIDVLVARATSAPQDGPSYPRDQVTLLAPIPVPPSIRDFFAFEQHVATARRNRGSEVPKEWYEFPVFYFTNPAATCGPDDDIRYPEGTSELDYELEIAAVIGTDEDIAGFTVMNDFSARDIQRKEMRVGLGPAKAKDFATSFGPVLVTPDEFDGTEATMTARVNGEERSRGNLADMHYSWRQILDQARRNTTLRPGDVIGSGTVGSGSILEHNDGRWLTRGDVVELEIEGLGTLRNRIV